MDRDVIVAKVLCKLNKTNINAGLKDWLMAAVLSFSTLFGGVSKAMATPKDLDKYLSEQKNKIEKSNKLKEHASVKKQFKDLGKGNGVGSFEVKAGPFTLVGDYYSLDGGMSFKKFKVEQYVDRKASDALIKAWEGAVNSIVEKMEKEYSKK